jgi:two-component system, chemotaxis family, protein-glutamate methylesterase/glutaminase
MNSDPKFIVVIGTSAGGVRALKELLMQLTPDMDAAFFVVIHLSRKGTGDILLSGLQQHSPLPCRIGKDKEPIERGMIYVAPPNEHMLLVKGQIIISKGAHENRWRPSINNLFRSAAAAYSTRVIGIILTGMLDDGTSGMASIKRCGGITIVQDPSEADYPDMPHSVLDHVAVDHSHSLSSMGSLLSSIMAGTEPREVEVPHDIQVEASIDQRVSTRIEDLAQFEKSNINVLIVEEVFILLKKNTPPITAAMWGTPLLTGNYLYGCLKSWRPLFGPRCG